VKRHLEKYYEKMDREPPWSKEKSYELDLLMILGMIDNMKLEVKEGKVLSARNRALLEQIKNALEALLKLAEPRKSTQELEEPQEDEEMDYSALLEETLKNLQEIQSMLGG